MSTAGANTIPLRRTPTVGLVLALIAVIGALAAIDIFLHDAEQTEVADQAQHAYAQGCRLLAAGKAQDAVEALRRAHALERENLTYELALVAALTAAGKTSEAQPLLNEVLDADRNDGAANLVAARLRLKQGKTVDAEAYYHRAIYGNWPRDAAAHRMTARFELIDVLAANNQKEDLLAELLLLQEEAKNDTTIEPRLGRLFLIAGSPGRAADVYRTLIRQQPESTYAYQGLGDAELEQGDYLAAHAAFNAALARNRNDAGLRSKLQLAAALAALDPTPRGLSSAEKYQRSFRILGWAQEDFEKCVQTRRGGATANEQQLLERAEDAMNKKPAQFTNELSEQTLALAEQIWQARLKACGATTAAEQEPLRLMMLKLAQ
jgi:tetratricopeptide (TPR) repeat protein